MNGILLLAAGSSRRFGSDKRFASLGDSTLLDCTIQNALNSRRALMVILRHDDFSLIDELAETYPTAHFLRCPDSPLGLGHSLSFGVAQAANRQFTGIAVAFADMPWVKPASYSAVAQHIVADKIIVPRYREHLGNPIGYGSQYFPELMSCRGEIDTNSVWQSHRDRVEYLELDDAGILRDVNFPEDIADARDKAG